MSHYYYAYKSRALFISFRYQDLIKAKFFQDL